MAEGTVFLLFCACVPALPVHVDSHKGRACPPDWESIPASQEIRVVRREFPRSSLLAENPQIFREKRGNTEIRA